MWCRETPLLGAAGERNSRPSPFLPLSPIRRARARGRVSWSGLSFAAVPWRRGNEGAATLVSHLSARRAWLGIRQQKNPQLFPKFEGFAPRSPRERSERYKRCALPTELLSCKRPRPNKHPMSRRVQRRRRLRLTAVSAGRHCYPFTVIRLTPKRLPQKLFRLQYVAASKKCSPCGPSNGGRCIWRGLVLWRSRLMMKTFIRVSCSIRHDQSPGKLMHLAGAFRDLTRQQAALRHMYNILGVGSLVRSLDPGLT